MMLSQFAVMDRRRLLSSALAAALTGILSPARGAAPTKIVLIHGRQQQGLNPETLKATWIGLLKEGCKKANVSFPENVSFEFPYYGDILDKFVRDSQLANITDVKAKGGQLDDEFLVFQAEIADELVRASGVTDAQIDAQYGANPKQKGPLNWEWVQAILQALDKHGGGMSLDAIQQFTRDVYLYLTRTTVKEAVDKVVSASLTAEPTVVLAHSLGSVVAYNILRNSSRALSVPLLVTIGSPLGIRAIRKQFIPLRYPTPVKAWFNAYDDRDVVSLYPLDQNNFPVSPPIRNFSGVKNSTSDRHGISGYLNDPEVAKSITEILRS